jgi:putative Mn2+ efflux pump MntP
MINIKLRPTLCLRRSNAKLHFMQGDFELYLTALTLAAALSVDSLFAAFLLAPPTQLGMQQRLRVHLNAFLFASIQTLLLWTGYRIGFSDASSLIQINYVKDYSHWIAFGILCAVAGKNFYDSRKSDRGETPALTQKPITIVLAMALATSLDALGVGIGMGLVKEESSAIQLKLISLAVMTYVFVFMGQRIAGRFPDTLKPRLQKSSAILLFLLGLHILHEHGVFR